MLPKILVTCMQSYHDLISFDLQSGMESLNTDLFFFFLAGLIEKSIPCWIKTWICCARFLPWAMLHSRISSHLVLSACWDWNPSRYSVGFIWLCKLGLLNGLCSNIFPASAFSIWFALFWKIGCLVNLSYLILFAGDKHFSQWLPYNYNFPCLN